MSNKYLDIAIEKVVKQEINKVLEQIRDEIKSYDQRERYPYGVISINKVLQIIDKYKEDEE